MGRADDIDRLAARVELAKDNFILSSELVADHLRLALCLAGKQAADFGELLWRDVSILPGGCRDTYLYGHALAVPG